jgi:hypothetical protein
MRKVSGLLLIMMVTVSFLFSRDNLKVQIQEPENQKESRSANNWYYGGTVGLSFGDYFSVSAEPYFAYKISPKLHAGLKFRYQYVNDTRYSSSGFTSHNYGGSAFMIYRFIPRLYMRAEYALMNYELYNILGNSHRETVPFFLLGGGYMMKISRSVMGYVEVLFDVLNDPNSPYESGTPFVSVGVMVGL